MQTGALEGANFIKTGNPNGKGLPVWPLMIKDAAGKLNHININVNTRAEAEEHADRYLFLEKQYLK